MTRFAWKDSELVNDVEEAAGIVFTASDHALMLKRSEFGDHAGEWAFPGGKVEDGENNFEGAAREAWEETGHGPETAKLWTHQVKNGVDYTTYLAALEDPFTPELNDEHEDFKWVPIDGPWPEPIHPGALVILKRFRMNETEVAEAIRDGDLSSPQFFHNIAFFAMRVTGTGFSYRPGEKDNEPGEHVYRDPEIYLTEKFLKRCNGLPILLEHPPGNMITSKEYEKRSIGVAIVPWIKGDEIWCIARIYDDFSITELREGKLSTSPSVYFKDPQAANKTIKLSGGENLLVEGNPDLLDHLAVCTIGVWDKGGAPSGVDNLKHAYGDSVKMAETSNENEMADKAKKDAEGGASARILELLEGLDGRLSKLEGGSADKAKKDEAVKSEAEKEEDNSKKDSGDGDKEEDKLEARAEDKKEEGEGDAKKDEFPPKKDDDKVAEGDAKKDAFKEGEKAPPFKKEDGDAKADSGRYLTESQLEALLTRRERAREREAASGDSARIASLNAERALVQEVAVAYGDSAPAPFYGESILDYKRRAWKTYQKHSATMGPINLATINDAPALDVICGVIKADSLAAVMSNSGVPEGSLREIRKTDGTGRVISTFVGKPSAWLNAFKGPVQYLHGINKGASR